MKRQITIGERFGALTVTAEAGKQPKKGRIVRCKCDCGEEVRRPFFRLHESSVCKRFCPTTLRTPESGERFGEYTVIREVERRDRRRMFLCRCSCGAEHAVRVDDLLHKKHPACSQECRYPLRERFWGKALRVGECLEWQGNNLGGSWPYGQFKINGNNRLAHRVAWELTHGPIPDGFDVLHRCDNPPCVNPDHLFLGTHQDNMRDRDSKGRGARLRGVSNRNAKLDEECVRVIRRRYEGGECAKEIAADYGVSPSLAWQVATHRAWRHVS